MLFDARGSRLTVAFWNRLNDVPSGALPDLTLVGFGEAFLFRPSEVREVGVGGHRLKTVRNANILPDSQIWASEKFYFGVEDHKPVLVEKCPGKLR